MIIDKQYNEFARKLAEDIKNTFTDVIITYHRSASYEDKLLSEKSFAEIVLIASFLIFAGSLSVHRQVLPEREDFRTIIINSIEDTVKSCDEILK